MLTKTKILTGNLDECVRNGGSLAAPGMGTSPHKPGGCGGILYGGLFSFETNTLLLALAVSPLTPEMLIDLLSYNS